MPTGFSNFPDNVSLIPDKVGDDEWKDVYESIGPLPNKDRFLHHEERENGHGHEHQKCLAVE